MSKVFNKSSQEFEKAEFLKCPRCSGFGSVAFQDEDGCQLCDGIGSLWQSVTGSGWTRAYRKHQDSSKLY